MLFRGLTLWLPLLPGLILARNDLSSASSSEAGASITGGDTPGGDTPEGDPQIDSARGLTAAQAAERLSIHGPNTLEAGRRRALCFQILARFKNPLVTLLLAASALEAVTGDFAGATIVVLMVALSVTLDFMQEHRADRAAEKLRKAASIRATVVRDGHTRDLPAEEIVPGDVILLAAGDLVPADGKLVEARDLFVNQALLTGEPYPVEKWPGPGDPAGDLAAAVGAVFMGTSVVSGSGAAIITQTGSTTVLGQIGLALARRPPPTAFEIGMRNFGLLILRLMKILANGGLNLSALDGWWAEAHVAELGWKLGDSGAGSADDARDASDLYSLLEREVVPEFHARDAEGLPRRWLARVRASMARLTPRFSSNRMVLEYIDRFYIGAGEAYRRRIGGGGVIAKSLAAWERALLAHFASVRVVAKEAVIRGDAIELRVEAYLGALSTEMVRVETFADRVATRLLSASPCTKLGSRRLPSFVSTPLP